jgi:diacylglycerol kinase (ATP)
MARSKDRRVLVLANPKSGLSWSFNQMRRAMDTWWDVPGTDLCYQFCQNPEDGLAKTRRAVERGTDIVLVVGGDGTVSTVGRALIGTDAALGMIPAGSGNGFARHFGIPLTPAHAARTLAQATVRQIDVGLADETPFLVTCSMAWDAAIARSFARSRIRGILPYAFAGVQGFFEYQPQDISVELDSVEQITFPSPVVFTVANLSQYGGGAKIAPRARPDDGRLELVVALRQDMPRLMANIHRLFDGSINAVPEVISRTFRSMRVRRAHASAIQIDGELVEAGREVAVRVLPRALKVLVPQGA